jgi:hypothetical protein
MIIIGDSSDTQNLGWPLGQKWSNSPRVALSPFARKKNDGSRTSGERIVTLCRGRQPADRCCLNSNTCSAGEESPLSGVASGKYQIAWHLTRAASPGKIPLYGGAQRLGSVRRGGDRRADSHARNHGGRRVERLYRFGRAALRPLDVHRSVEPREGKRGPPDRRQRHAQSQARRERR